MKILKNKIILFLIIIFSQLYVSKAIDCPATNSYSWNTVNISTTQNQYGHYSNANAQVRNNNNGTIDIIFDWTSLVNDSGGMLSDETIKKMIIDDGISSVIPNTNYESDFAVSIYHKTYCYSDVTVALQVKNNWQFLCCDDEAKAILNSQITQNSNGQYIIHTHYSVLCGEKCCYKTYNFQRRFNNNLQLVNNFINLTSGDNGCISTVNLGNHCETNLPIPCVGGDCSKP